MKFLQWLNEEENYEALAEEIKRSCKFYLSLLKRNNIPVPFSRYMKDVKDQTGVRKVRKNRKPRLGDPKSADKINAVLEKEGHARRDRSVIATSKERAIFGSSYAIFPVGKFDYTWIKSYDWNALTYIDSTEEEWLVSNVLYGDWKDEEAFERGMKIILNNLTTNKGINFAFGKGYEIWFNCDNYYYISAERFNQEPAFKNIME